MNRSGNRIDRQISDSSVFIRGSQLLPFTEDAVCPACGSKQASWFDNLLRVLHGQQRWNFMGYTFCAGGKAPTEASSSPIGAMLGHEVVHACAGITEPHLHRQCGRCDFRFLMKTKKSI